MKAIWWVAAVFFILSYGVYLIGVFGQCGNVRNLFTYEECNTPHVAALAQREVWIDIAFNVTTDLVGELKSRPHFLSPFRDVNSS